MRNKLVTYLKRVVAGLLVSVTLTVVITPVNHVYAAPTYTTHSPLLSGDTMAVDEIDPYELVCYGVFLSNFCVPFVDSYISAFSQTCDMGSKGAGAHALTFATGGDISSDSIVRRMTNYVLDSLAREYQPLVVESYALDDGVWKAKNAVIDMTTSDEKDTTVRLATLADLLPVVSGMLNSSNKEFDYDFNANQVWNHAWVAGSTSAFYDDDLPEGIISDFHITHGVLSTFYISNDGFTVTEKIPVFDMRDQWDVQIPSQCLLYAAYKDDGAYLADIFSLLNNAQNTYLVMDSIGNICAKNDTTGQLVVIVPAYLNKHLTTDNTVNLAGSAILNTVANTEDKLAVASSVSGVRAVNNNEKDGLKIGTVLDAGIGAAIHKGSDLQPGTSFLYNIASDYDDNTEKYNISNATYRNFIDSGLDLKNRLRWSTTIKYTSNTDTGLDIQNYCIATGDTQAASDAFIIHDGTTYRLNNSYDFSLQSILNRVAASTSIDITDYDNERIYEYLSVFQTAAQLYSSVAPTTEDSKVKSYYCSLQSGNTKKNQLFAGINTDSAGQDSKGDLVYVPIAADYSYINHVDHGWWDVNMNAAIFADSDDLASSDILRYSKQASTIAIDMYHGKTYGLPTDVRQSLGSAIANNINIESTAAGEDLFKVTNPLKILSDAGSNTVTVGKEQTTSYMALIKKLLKTSDYRDFYTYEKGGSTSIAFLNDEVIKNWARIALATPTLQIACSYLGLRDSSTFSIYASDMYYTYLDMYGFLDKKHNFKTEIYALLSCEVHDKTAEEMGELIMTQGLTAEQKQQVMKDNAYLMLSTGSDGREYRSRMVSGMIEEWLIDSYDKTCYGDTESEYFQTLTSTSKSFVNLPTYAENWLTKWVVAKWDVVLPLVMLFLFILVAAFGVLNGKKVSWILANLLLTACMLVVLPGAAEMAPYLVEKVSDTAFKDVIGTMTISEAVEDDTIMADIEKQYAGYSDEIKSAVKSISALGTSGSLLLKQDMTRKVVPSNTVTTYEQLKGLATAQWLIPNLLSMTGADSAEESLDYVYRAVGEKRAELRIMKKTEVNHDTSKIATFLTANDCNTNNTLSTYAVGSSRTRSAAVFSDRHLTDLLLLELNGTAVEQPTSESIPDLVSLYFDISVYDGEHSNNAVNYLQGTETILPYFYLVAYDTLLNAKGTSDFSTLTVADFYNGMRHVQTDLSGKLYSNSMTLKDSNTIDFLDLSYVFDTYIPYLNAMQEKAKKALGETIIGPEYSLYAEEPAAFLFECNWADKILNVYDFGDDAKPSTYPARYGRNMIFCRSELVELGLSVDDLTEVELRCIEINDEVDKQWTLLINYIGTEGITVDILAEQMALTATTAFNSIMSKDRVINSNYALYPNSVSIRTINFDTMMKLVLMSNFGLADTNQNSMRVVLAESGLLVGFVLWFLALLVTHVVPFVAQVSMAVVFYASILSCVYNAAVDGKEKLKTCGGAAVTCLIIGAETCLYVYSYALIIGNTHKVLSIDKIQAGTTVATGKVFAILVITIIYLFLLIFQAWKNAMNFRDMGAQMWASYSKKTFDTVTNFAKGFASKLKGAVQPGELKSQAIKSALGDVKLNTKIEDEVKVKNTSKDPLYIKESNSATEATYIYSVEDESDNSGYVVKAGDKGPVVQEVPKQTSASNDSKPASDKDTGKKKD